jgi:hypothetical protein
MTETKKLAGFGAIFVNVFMTVKKTGMTETKKLEPRGTETNTRSQFFLPSWYTLTGSRLVRGAPGIFLGYFG